MPNDLNPAEVEQLLAEATPGPWSMEVLTQDDPNGDEWATAVEVASDSGWHIHGHDLDYDDAVVVEIVANARLIALAPTLAAETIALRVQAAKDKARIERLEAALRPFAEAWGVALQQAGDHPDSLRTLGPLGALAAHQVSGVHFQRARAALEDGEWVRSQTDPETIRIMSALGNAAQRKPSLDDLWAQKISFLRGQTGASPAEIEAALANDPGYMAWREVLRLRTDTARLDAAGRE